jgi:hypothetical protein
VVGAGALGAAQGRMARPMTGRQQIGPCVLGAWGAKWIAVRCPHEHADLMRGAGGLWEPGGGCG